MSNMITMLIYKKIRTALPALGVIALLLLISNHGIAQNKEPYVRIAQLVVDSMQLEKYKAALAIHATAAISKEPGVLTLYAVYNKANPTHVTVFEIYASEAAYKLHIQAPHFLQYKATVENMVKSLVLTDVVPIALEAKPNLHLHGQKQ